MKILAPVFFTKIFSYNFSAKTYKFRVVAAYSNYDNNHGPTSARFTMKVAPVFKPKPPASGPVIVEAKPTSVNSIMIRWQVISNTFTTEI